MYPKRFMITGPYPYWNGIAAELLRRGGMQCDLFEPCGEKDIFTWLFLRKWRNYDAVYHVCGKPTRAMVYLLLLQRRPVILHWIGSDVIAWKEGKQHQGLAQKLYRYLVLRRTVLHLSDSPDLLSEMKAFGIEAQTVRLLPAKIEAKVEPLPEIFTVLSYWSETRKHFYRGDWILRLAREFPNIRFLILLAKGDTEQIPSNVTFLGPQDHIEEIYLKSSVLIRLPEHDSLSAMVLEMLARGRYVIYNKPIEGCHLATTYEEVRSTMPEIINYDTPNEAGAQYVRTSFSIQEQVNCLRAILQERIGDR